MYSVRTLKRIPHSPIYRFFLKKVRSSKRRQWWGGRLPSTKVQQVFKGSERRQIFVQPMFDIKLRYWVFVASRSVVGAQRMRWKEGLQPLTLNIAELVKSPAPTNLAVFRYFFNINLRAGGRVSTLVRLLPGLVALGYNKPHSRTVGGVATPGFASVNRPNFNAEAKRSLLGFTLRLGTKGFRYGCNIENLQLTNGVAIRRPFEHLAWLLVNALSLTYWVQHQALDRKLRKIVKNKYRYVRRYVYIRARDRVRMGLRLCNVAKFLFEGRTWSLRVLHMLQELAHTPEVSILRYLHAQHQQTSLRALGLK